MIFQTFKAIKNNTNKPLFLPAYFALEFFSRSNSDDKKQQHLPYDDVIQHIELKNVLKSFKNMY